MLQIPEAYGGNYREACQPAREQLAARRPEEVARIRGVTYQPEPGRFIVRYCGQLYFVTCPDGQVSRPGGGPVPLSDQVVILLYLAGEGEVPLAQRWLSFLELPNGSHHNVPFQLAGIKPLALELGPHPARLLPAARELGGGPLEGGEAAVVIPALPRLPLGVYLWSGDEEFSPSATLLFDASASFYLDTAGLFVLGINTSLKLRRAARRLQD